MLRRAASAFLRRAAGFFALMLGVAASAPANHPTPNEYRHCRERSQAGQAGRRRLAAMNISASHSSSVRKLQRAQRIRDRLGEG